MIRVYECALDKTPYETDGVFNQAYIFEFRGLSTDDKPTETFDSKPIATGSAFLETDTGEVFFYDEVLTSWTES
mgnify:CR=1 FL=1